MVTNADRRWKRNRRRRKSVCMTQRCVLSVALAFSLFLWCVMYSGVAAEAPQAAPVTSARGTRVRSAPAAPSDVLGALPGGARSAQVLAYEAMHSEALAHELERCAEAHAARRSFTLSEQLYSEALRFAPDHARLLAARAAVRGALGRPDDALADAHASVRAAPAWPRAHAQLASALEQKRQLGRAQACMERAAWLARTSQGEPEQARLYARAALALRARKAGIELPFSGAAEFGDIGLGFMETLPFELEAARSVKVTGARSVLSAAPDTARSTTPRSLLPGGAQPQPQVAPHVVWDKRDVADDENW